MNANHPYDLVIGLDRSDRKADLYSIHTCDGKTQKQIIETAPEALHTWLASLHQQHPQARVATVETDGILDPCFDDNFGFLFCRDALGRASIKY